MAEKDYCAHLQSGAAVRDGAGQLAGGNSPDFQVTDNVIKWGFEEAISWKAGNAPNVGVKIL